MSRQCRHGCSTEFAGKLLSGVLCHAPGGGCTWLRLVRLPCMWLRLLLLHAAFALRCAVQAVQRGGE